LKRDRTLIAGAIFGTILAGSSSRVFADALPPWVSANAGDALWAAAVYLLAALLLPGSRPFSLAIATLLVSFAVEFSQLIHLPWLEMLRANPVFRLFLGNAFVWADLPRYAIGTFAAFTFDILVLNRFHRLKRESRV
jgi:hypothetical protein